MDRGDEGMQIREVLSILKAAVCGLANKINHIAASVS